MSVACQKAGCTKDAVFAPVIRFFATEGREPPAVECPLSLYLCEIDIEDARLDDFLAGGKFWDLADRAMDSLGKVRGCRSTAELIRWPLEKAERYFGAAKERAP